MKDAPTHKVKRILVYPGGRLSYQYHHQRAEVWTMVSRVGRITLDGEIKDYAADATTIILWVPNTELKTLSQHRWFLLKCSTALTSGKMILCALKMIIKELN